MAGYCAAQNLLFGIIALQMDFISRDQLIAGLNAWVLRKERPLGAILVEQGALPPDLEAMLNPLVTRHLQQHGNDPEQSLAALSAVESSLRASLAAIGEGDVDRGVTCLAEASTLLLSPTAVDCAPTHGASTSRFRVLRPHARGGLGEVFVAEDQELHREVALKQIQTHRAQNPDDRARFVREAEITGALEHPGIVPVYGLGQDGHGRPYYAMRFIRGDSLKEAIRQFHEALPQLSETDRNLQLRQLLGRFVDVCEAMQYAHDRGVLHRDLKPDNVMLGKYGETLVVDWGLAKPLGTRPETAEAAGEATLHPLFGNSQQTVSGSKLGTPQYMSPEQAAGKIEELGPATDVYSLGATLYCLLTGVPPFAPEQDLTLILAKCETGGFPKPRERASWIPRVLEAVCLKAMSLQPAERYGQPLDVAREIERWLADEPVKAYPEPRSVRFARWRKKHRVLVRSGITAVVLAAIVATISTVMISAEVERGRRTLYAAQMNLAKTSWEAARAGVTREVLSRYAPGVPDQELRGFEWHYLNQLCSYTHDLEFDFNSSRPMTSHGERVATVHALDDQLKYSPSGPKPRLGDVIEVRSTETGKLELEITKESADIYSVVHSLAFSPDGRTLAVGLRDGTIELHSLTNGQITLTIRAAHKGRVDTEIVAVECLTYSPDGRRLASVGEYPGKDIKTWDADTGAEIIAFHGHGGFVSSAVFSPDGTRIASIGRNESDTLIEIKVWNPETGAEFHTFPGYGATFSPDGRSLAVAHVDENPRLLDVATGATISTLAAQPAGVTCAAFSSDGGQLACGNYDSKVRICDVTTGIITRTICAGTYPVSFVAFSPDNSRLLTGSEAFRTWKATTDNQKGFELPGDGRVTHIAFSPDCRFLAATRQISDGSMYSKRTLECWDMQTRGLQYSVDLSMHPVSSVAFSPDGKSLSTISDLGLLVWDAVTGASLGESNALSEGGMLSPLRDDGRWTFLDRFARGKELQATNGTQSLKLVIKESSRLPRWDRDLERSTQDTWNDLRWGTVTMRLEGSPAAPAISPDGALLAFAINISNDHSNLVSLREAATGKERLRVRVGSSLDVGWIEVLTFSPDGARLAAGERGGTITLWDTTSGHVVLALTEFKHDVTCLAFSPDGATLAAGNDAGSLLIWDGSRSMAAEVAARP